MARELLFSVKSDDFTVQTFTVSGAGGQGRDHVNSGVRLIHNESGARGESREFREQGRNKRAALVKLTKDPRFTFWVDQEIRRIDGKQTAEQWVEAEMQKLENLKFEVKNEKGQWVDMLADPE